MIADKFKSIRASQRQFPYEIDMCECKPQLQKHDKRNDIVSPRYGAKMYVH